MFDKMGKEVPWFGATSISEYGHFVGSDEVGQNEKYPGDQNVITSVGASLHKIEGVEGLAANEGARLRVTYDPSKTDSRAIREAIQKAGHGLFERCAPLITFTSDGRTLLTLDYQLLPTRRIIGEA